MALAALRSKLARSLLASLKNTPATTSAMRAPGLPLARTVATASTRSPVASSPFLSAAGAASSLSPLRAGALHRVAFSTQVSKKEPTTLGEILADELQTEESLYHRDELLDRIPAGFELVESDGDSNVELVTTYKGEQVSVVFSITDFKNEEYDDDFDFDEDEDDEEAVEEEGEGKGKDEGDLEVDLEDYDDDDYESEPEPVIDFNVHISKGSETLTFECTTDGSIYSINTVNMSNEEAEEDKIEYEGPNFEDLEENLQEGFFEYLHERGVDYDFARFLFTVAIDKEQREYMNWLKDIKKFVAK